MKNALNIKFVLGYLSAFAIVAFGFQNCSPTRFTMGGEEQASLAIPPLTNPLCDPNARPLDQEQLQCRNSSSLNAIQRYLVVCQANGLWTRTPVGDVDHSQCLNACIGTRPSDKENVACPAPNQSVNLAVQNYTVQCLSSGQWTRTITGNVDYSLCPVTCDPTTRPSTTSAMACPAPYSSLMSGIQNYTVTCGPDGQWVRAVAGPVDYRNCPQSCDNATRPASTMNVKCPSTNDILAVQNYSVICNANGTWSRTPTTLNTSQCPAPTCNSATRPPSTAPASCPAPFQAQMLAIQNYTVTCSGTNWIQAAGALDTSKCPKSCAGNPPASGFDSVACPAPFADQNLARRNYSYVCNNTTGQYVKTPSSTINYSFCPQACSGNPPANRVAVACPNNQVGTAYQNYSVTCNTTTGQYTRTATTLDTSGCLATATCPTTQPANFEMVACPAPNQSQILARQNYSVTCQGTSWVRTPTTLDTAACTANPCASSVNPGTRKNIMACPGGASGMVFQTCSVVCSGSQYTQANCSQNNYSECDCGPNATFNPVTQQCISNIPTLSCTKSAYACSETVSCTAQGADQNLQICDSSGCANLLGRAGWSYQGSGRFTYNYVNQNSSTTDIPVQWKVRNTNGTESAPVSATLKACVVPPPPPPPPPPPAQTTTGWHCDIGGNWGWNTRDWYVCPTGTNKAAPSTVGGCPEGWTNYNDIGCYISNRDPRRHSGCATSDPNDECCMYLCSASAPAPTWTCSRDSGWEGSGEDGTWVLKNTCTCTSQFGDRRTTNWRVTQPAQMQCYFNGEAGESCYVTVPEQGVCETP